jgi:hypothetical protein
MLFVVFTVNAQTFDVFTNPRVLSVMVGDTARFTVKVNPYDGYDATVFCKANLPEFNLKLRVTPDFSNAPYSSGMLVEFRPLAEHLGEHEIIIEGWNGSLHSYDTVRVQVNSFAYPDRPGWTRYTTENSPLPSDTITAFAFDTDGSAWIGTTNGLAKFDGSVWTTFTSVNNGDSVLVDNHIMSIAVDSSNVIWVSTRGGISRRAGNAWTIYRKGRGFPDENSLPLNIVSLATSSSLDVYALERTLNAAGKVTGGILWKKDGETWTSEPVGLNYFQVAVDPQGRVYTLSQDTLARFDGQFRSVYPGSYGSNMSIDDLGRVWTSRGSTVKRLDGGGWKERALPASQSGSIGVIASDHLDGAWMSLRNTSVAHFDGFSWATYDISDHQDERNKVTTLQTHHDGTVWAGTNGGGMLILDPDKTSSLGTSYESISTGSTGSLAIVPNPALGQETALLLNEFLEQGEHKVQFNAGVLPVGNYFVKLDHGGSRIVQSLVVVH